MDDMRIPVKDQPSMLEFYITAASKYSACIPQITHLIKADFRRNYECVRFSPQC